jgi:hypothetical protein
VGQRTESHFRSGDGRALADWFAVVALFRRIPLPFVARHTAIIPRNKDSIADNLGFRAGKISRYPSLVAHPPL